jgi:hypothetical protein
LDARSIRDQAGIGIRSDLAPAPAELSGEIVDLPCEYRVHDHLPDEGSRMRRRQSPDAQLVTSIEDTEDEKREKKAADDDQAKVIAVVPRRYGSSPKPEQADREQRNETEG